MSCRFSHNPYTGFFPHTTYKTLTDKSHNVISDSMGKNRSKTPSWLENLKTLMDACGYNPRSLSLEAGLNPTAVRDMLEGRIRFPRYDTVKALAEALKTTPARLMGDAKSTHLNASGDGLEDNMELLVEIIARLQETANEEGLRVSPRDFAAMAATIYRQIQKDGSPSRLKNSVKPKIHDLLLYESIKQKAAS